MAAAAGVLLLGLYLLRVPLLVGAARLLEVRDPERRSDLIYLLNGEAHQVIRARHAAELYARGVAPRIVVARAKDPPAVEMGLYPNDTDVSLGVLARAGVPRQAITVLRTPGGVASTADEARVLRSHLARRPARRVTVVTTDYHTARARWNLGRALKGLPVEVAMSGAALPGVHARNWWRSEAGLIRYFQEYLKFAHNFAYH